MKTWTVLVALGAMVLAGCGGSTESGSSASGSNNGSVAIFVTDAMDGNDHVFVKIHRVELQSGSKSLVVFDDPAGKVIDVRQLHDENGPKFVFLGSDDLPRGAYTSAKVTLSKELGVFAAGAASADAKVFEDALKTGNGMIQVNVPLEAGVAVGVERSSVVLDFDLAAWTENAGKVVPVIKRLSDAAFANRERHIADVYPGVVGGLSGNGPDKNFSLSSRGGSFKVRISANTVVFNANGKESPALKNGQRIVAEGTMDPSTGQFLATRVKLVDATDMVDPGVAGKPSGLDSTAGKFELEVNNADRFIPTKRSVQVVATEGTVFRSGGGAVMDRTAFFVALASAKTVEAEGVFDAAQNTLSAKRIQIADRSTVPQVVARGAALDAKDGEGFEVELSGWEGFPAEAMQKVAVKTGPETKYQNGDGGPLTKDQFYAEITKAKAKLEARGVFSGSSLQAEVCRLQPGAATSE